MTVINEHQLMQLPVCCDEPDGTTQFQSLRGIVLDDHDTFMTVISTSPSNPVCRLLHWTRVQELRNLLKDPA
jgi:hypothetical protein